MIKISIENMDGQSDTKIVIDRIADSVPEQRLGSEELLPHRKTNLIVGSGIHYVIREESVEPKL